MKRLEIGGGFRPRTDYLQLDVKPLPGIHVVGDARRLPFLDNQFEEIYAHWVLEHFAYQEISYLLKEWKRVLAPGGKLQLVTNNGAAHLRAFSAGIINVHELNRMLFGLELVSGSEPDQVHSGQWCIEDLHKMIWTKQLVQYFFGGFSQLDIVETWVHREQDGTIKCPGIIITAEK